MMKRIAMKQVPNDETTHIVSTSSENNKVIQEMQEKLEKLSATDNVNVAKIHEYENTYFYKMARVLKSQLAKCRECQ